MKCHPSRLCTGSPEIQISLGAPRLPFLHLTHQGDHHGCIAGPGLPEGWEGVRSQCEAGTCRNKGPVLAARQEGAPAALSLPPEGGLPATWPYQEPSPSPACRPTLQVVTGQANWTVCCLLAWTICLSPTPLSPRWGVLGQGVGGKVRASRSPRTSCVLTPPPF